MVLSRSYRNAYDRRPTHVLVWCRWVSITAPWMYDIFIHYHKTIQNVLLKVSIKQFACKLTPLNNEDFYRYLYDFITDWQLKEQTSYVWLGRMLVYGSMPAWYIKNWFTVYLLSHLFFFNYFTFYLGEEALSKEYTHCMLHVTESSKITTAF